MTENTTPLSPHGASEAQRAGFVDLTLSNHGNPEKQVATLQLGKLQALKELTKNLGLPGRKTAARLTAEDRQRSEECRGAPQSALDHSNEEQRRLELQLNDTGQALWRPCKAIDVRSG